jgi:quercetin dioxygenase-like cupin family protein
MIIDDKIDALNTMYPSYAFICYDKYFFSDMNYSNLFGYAIDNTSIEIGDKVYNLHSGNYCSIFIKKEHVNITGNFVGIFKLGFRGQNVIGETPDNTGRLSYIDGCSDEMLVYPPRLGDPSLNYLYFPKNTNQSFHNHPSIRIGYVLSGSGIAQTCNENIKLTAGTLFMLSEKEIHRFTTDKKEMRIVAYHPDGDWGPTDESHTMLNRTHKINI